MLRLSWRICDGVNDFVVHGSQSGGRRVSWHADLHGGGAQRENWKRRPREVASNVDEDVDSVATDEAGDFGRRATRNIAPVGRDGSHRTRVCVGIRRSRVYEEFKPCFAVMAQMR